MRRTPSRVTRSLALALSLLLLAPVAPTRAVESGNPQQAPPEHRTPTKWAAIVTLTEALGRWYDLIEPPIGEAPNTLVTRVELARSEGLPKEVGGAKVDLAFQGPDHLRVSASVADATYTIGRNGQQLWVHVPGKQFALLGKTGVPRFAAYPKQRDVTVLEPLALPVSREQIALLPLMLQAKNLDSEDVRGQRCTVIGLSLLPAAAEMLGAKDRPWQATLWLRESDLLPARLDVKDGQKLDVRIEFTAASVEEPWAAEKWKLKPAEGDHVETVALGHLKRLLDVAPKELHQEIPTLGPATGQREVVATSGEGRLERIDGTRVLFLKGSPEQMGKQHGELLRNEIRDVMDRILYGIGVGSSFGTGKWFFGEIENAQARLEKFTDPKVLREMDAMADAVGIHRQEAHLGNFFPELFHCSGFALLGKSTNDGHLYHGRVLDYLKGVGLEQNAVLIVHRPNYGHAWVNASYAGFVGSVTAMNEKGIAIGEMGGGGYGAWDGKPMAQLLREVMEQASTLDEAVAIMRKGPRTCEYYYVISSGKEMKAVGIAATPTTFETIDPGQAHPRLKRPVEDAVLLSAGNRYEELVNRVQGNYGQFDAQKAIDLMSRPVCMTSNIQSVLFVPDTLDFYVANADGKNVASHTRFTKYNLKTLLDEKVEAAR